MEVTKRPPQVIVDPKAPLTIGLAPKCHRPCTLGTNFQPMLALGLGIIESGSGLMKVSLGCVIDVAAIHQKGNEVSHMVMVMGIDVITHPMMNSHGVSKKDERPPIHVGCIAVFEDFLPTDLEGLELTVWFHIKSNGSSVLKGLNIFISL